VSVWRHLSVGGLTKSQERLAGGLQYLREHRDGKGRWRRFPYYYTLLALSGISGPRADREIKYVAAGLERLLKRRGSGDRYDLRRRTVAERILIQA
jgi:hypothetical protein